MMRRGFGDTPLPPAGYWVNPTNSTQWLPQSDAAKIGSYCFNPFPGIYAAGGNEADTVLYCGKLPQNQEFLVYGGAALALALILPGGWKALALIPAAFGVLGATLGQVGI